MNQFPSFSLSEPFLFVLLSLIISFSFNDYKVFRVVFLTTHKIRNYGMDFWGNIEFIL